MRAMLPSGCHLQKRKNLRLHDMQASGEGEEDVTLLLHELPHHHHLRNSALQTIDVRIRCRHTKSSRDPRTWKIKNNSYNQLNDSWQTNFDFIVNYEPES
jgi:hypothetical protein